MSVIVPNGSRCLAAVVLCLCLPAAQAETGVGYTADEWDPATKEFREIVKDWQEGVVLNADTGNYIITYRSSSGTFYETIFEPATKTDPTLKSKFKLIESNSVVRYEFKLRNGSKAKQNIEMFLTYVSNINPGGPVAPPDWDGRAFPTLTDSNLRLSWTHDGVGPSGGLAPGKSAGGFWVEGNDLPGIVTMEITGNARHTTWLGHQPSIDTVVGKQVLELEEKNFIPRPAAAPKIPNPIPFNPIMVLVGVRNHLNADLVSMKLVDTTFAAQLDRPLGAALDAAKVGNTSGAKDNLKQFRKLLKQEHEDVDREDDKDFDSDEDDKANQGKPRLIDKLAARVLDFDVKYVLKRLGDD